MSSYIVVTDNSFYISLQLYGAFYQVLHHPLLSQQSRMVTLVLFCPGLHPMLPLGTGSTMRVVEVIEEWWMSLVALLRPTA